MMFNFRQIMTIAFGGIISITTMGFVAASASAAVLDLGDVGLGPPDLAVGDSGVGSVEINGGSQETREFVILGSGPEGIGTLLVDGPGSLLTVNSGFVREVGVVVAEQGVGALVIRNGGVVDVGNGVDFVFNVIGNNSGSTGSMTVRDAGSAFNAGGTLEVANGFFNSDFNIGILGAPTAAELNILEGGVVTANNLSIGGSENASGLVNVTGADSEIRGDPNLGSTSFTVANVGTGLLNVTNGGTVTGDFASVAIQPNSSGQINVTGVNVTGDGSQMVLDGGSFSIGFAGNGSLDISDGASATVLFGTVARLANSRGVVNVTGPGSVLKLEGNDGTFAAFLTVGRNNLSSGALNVLDGGQVVVDSLDPAIASAGINLARNPESTGTATVMGSGSEIRIKGTRGFIGVGRRGTGSMTVGIGANVVIEDTVDGRMMVAPVSRSVGMLRVLGETKDQSGVPTGTVLTTLDAGSFLGLGIGLDGVSSAGVATLIVDSGGTVTAGTVEIGPNGTVFSNGLIIATTINNSGVINPGFSPGVATFVGILVIKPGGVLKIEVFGDQVGEFDVVNATSIVFEEGSQLELVIDETVVGEVVVLIADEVNGTATVTTTVVDDTGDPVSTTETEASIGAGGSELSLDISVGGETEIVSSGAAIDVKPSDPDNLINTGSNAVIPVALLADIRPSDVTGAFFGPAAAIAKGLGREDINGDGTQDLIARFRLRETGITKQSVDACLTIETANGQTFEGCDAITVVK